MKTGLILLFTGIIIGIMDIIFGVSCHYQYNKNIGSYWELADKASIISKKAEQIDKFVYALKGANLEGNYDAIFLTTPNNGFNQNFEALLTLQKRLHEIETMDIRSFEYQTAIQQITAQEQGEASNMLTTLRGVWIKTHYFLLWDWICGINILLCFLLITIGFVIVTES